MLLSCYIHRNPLWAGMVRHLIDYPWSSYPAYAYGKKSPGWLHTTPFLSYFDTKDRNKSYRVMVQGYSREEKRIWVDFRHGLFLGSQRFVYRIKSRYLSDCLRCFDRCSNNTIRGNLSGFNSVLY